MPARKYRPDPPEGVVTIDTGNCELVRDRDTPGWLMLVNDQPSSHIADDPHVLAFDYMRWMAAAIHTWYPGGKSGLSVLHLGGAGCALARYIDREFVEPRQVAVEIDARLAASVRDWFDLPRAPRLRIRVGDAQSVVHDIRPASTDVVVRDVFAGDRTPAELRTADFAASVHRLLRPGGLYLVNSADRGIPGHQRRIGTITTVKNEISCIADEFNTVLTLTPMAVLHGRRSGNVVVAGSDAAPAKVAALATALLADPNPAHFLDDSATRAFIGEHRTGR